METIKSITKTKTIFAAYTSIIDNINLAYSTQNWNSVVEETKKFLQYVIEDIFNERGFELNNGWKKTVGLGDLIYSRDWATFMHDGNMARRLMAFNTLRVDIDHKRAKGNKEDANRAFTLIRDFEILMIKRLDNEDVEIADERPKDIFVTISDAIEDERDKANAAKEEARRQAEIAEAERLKANQAQLRAENAEAEAEDLKPKIYNRGGIPLMF